MSANTYGRQVVIPLTNKSGGGVIAGDVVVIDTTNNDAFTTSTAGAFTGTVGVAQETIANNAVGRVLMSGYAALINTSASVTRGNYGKTHTVAKQAVDAGASRVTGTFVQFFTGGTTPDGQVFPVDLAGAALTNPMTTKGDVILGDTGGTPTRLGAGTSAFVLTSNGAAAFPSWQALPAAAGILAVHSYAPATTAYTTTSGTMADVDATNMAVTFTAPASGNIIVRLSAWGDDTNATGSGSSWGLREATTNLCAAIVFRQGTDSQGYIHVEFYLTGISAGSHTYKWAFACNPSGVSGTTRVVVGANAAAGDFGAGVMSVIAAP